MVTIFKLARVQSNLKALEVARKSGLAPSRLSLIENGWVDPTPREIAKLRKAIPNLGVDAISK